jgi:hypothetical protein
MQLQVRKQLQKCKEARRLLTQEKKQNSDRFVSLIEKHSNQIWDIEAIACNPNTVDLDKYVSGGRSLCFNGVSYNPNITVMYIRNNIKARWSWNAISQNPAITVQDHKNNPDLPWSLDGLCLNPNFTIKYLLSIADRKTLNWKNISLNPNLTQEFIDTHQDIKFDYFNLCLNSNIKPQNLSRYICGTLFERRLSSNPNLTIDFIDHNMDKYWDWNALSANPRFTFDFIISTKSKYPWEPSGVSRNPNVTMATILQHHEYAWDWEHVSVNPSITIDDINQHPEFEWNWEMVSSNPFDREIKRLELQYKEELNKLIKMAIYWNLVVKMSKPPTGYYFLNDVRQVIPDDQKQLFDQLRKKRDFTTLQSVFFSHNIL